MTKEEKARNTYILETVAKIKSGDFDKMPGKLSELAQSNEHTIKRTALRRKEYAEKMEIFSLNGGKRPSFGNCSSDQYGRSRHPGMRVRHGRQ